MLNTSGSYTTDPSQYHMIESDEERARREYAGNYTQSLIKNAVEKLSGQPDGVHITSTTTTIIDSESPVEDQTKLNRLVQSDRSSHISDELIYLLDAGSVVSMMPLAPSFETKTFSFRKSAKSEDSSGLRQPSLAQIIESFRSGPGIVGDCVEPTNPDISHYPFAAPFPIGIKLRSRANPLETGSHVISHVEPDSLASEAGIRPGCRLVRINDVLVEDKTHEFVLFFLNYVLRKNSCELVELTVDEPSMESVAASEVASIADTSEMVTTGHDHLRSILSEAAAHLKSTSASSYRAPVGTLDDAHLSVSTPAIYSLASNLSSDPQHGHNNNNLSLYNTQFYSQSIPQSSSTFPALNSTTVVAFSPHAPLASSTSTLDAAPSSHHSSSTGIENLKSIIAQITRIRPDVNANPYEPLRPPRRPDDEYSYSYETSVNIPHHHPTPTVTSELIVQPNIPNLKSIFVEAINSNYEDYVKIRGISYEQKTDCPFF